MKLKKLDKRMTGYGDFQYSVDFSYRMAARQYFECQQWCVAQWGRAPEIDIWQSYPDLQNPAWSWERGLVTMKDWCQENCQDKWRDDFHRVIKDYWDEWICNEIGGGDVLFFAFKSEQDCLWFTLRWA